MIEKITSHTFTGLFKNKSIQNFIFLITIQASNIVITLISMPLLIQSIGVDGFGLVNLSLSVIILANILVGFGYNLSGPREVALLQNDKESLSHVVSNVVFSKVLMALLATIGLIVAVFGLNMFKEYQWILLFSVLLLFSEATLPLWFFQGMEKMKLISIANVFSKLLYLMGIVLFIHAPDSAKWVNFIMGASGLGVNILLLLYIHYMLEIRFYKPKFLQLFASLKDNGLLFLSNIATHISVHGGLIILSFFSVAEVLGMFSLAERISMVLRMFPSMVIHSIYPNTSKLLKDDIRQFVLFLRKAYFGTMITALIISLFTFAMAPFIIELLAKTRLEESVTYLRILAFIPLLACLNIANVVMFLGRDQKELMFRSSWILLLFMLPACLSLTYLFGGMGLCYGLLSTELVVLLICTILNLLKNRDLMNAFWKSKY
ncbi:oligosaccharide flippase family protein [Aquiflexum gelatinilyticum]|uniref:oligosaccharide flippase family protein n=1 Tax=Aquiflexum gelatinilyticum TaxID=2961943 RepID=UPI0021698127|nr:oligosaccharide flippase family protein [Aquiflexum gelatinilyticum]MCS4435661.1 oligosaccharide flippase family protein [Aquiflexum gelatinilyticum]